MSTLNKLMSHVTILSNGCWLWTGAKDSNGYGRVSKVSYGESLAHRAIYSKTKNIRLNRKIYICHKCDFPSCVNPDHMIEGDQFVNLADAKAKGRRLGETPKIPIDVLEKVKAAIGSGSTQRSIAKTFGLSEATVSNIKHNRKINYGLIC